MLVMGSKVVVTGGASGIGRAIVDELIKRDCQVLIADIDGKRAESTARELGRGAVGAQCDVSNHASVVALQARANESFGHVDIVFANAGVSLSGPVLDAAPEAVDWVIGVNFKGIWNTASVFGKDMRDSGRQGHLCITGSEHSLGMQFPGSALYTATKHAVLGMADVLRAECSPQIGVSVLCPGLVSTELHLSKRHSPLKMDDEAALARSGALISRGMEPGVIAQAAIVGVERGDFLIVTHPTALAAANRRWEEIKDAFAAQAPWQEELARYDVAEILKDFASEDPSSSIGGARQ